MRYILLNAGFITISLNQYYWRNEGDPSLRFGMTLQGEKETRGLGDKETGRGV
jgi:hypothetical protein